MGGGYDLGDVGGLEGVVWDINLVTSMLCTFISCKKQIMMYKNIDSD